jgi:hypothetical protein
MFRSRVSGLLMSLALLAGVVALTAWVGSTTVLNPDRVTHVAGTILQSPQGRDALTRELTDRLAAAAPESQRATVESASRRVVTDPRTSGALERLAAANTPSQRDAAAGALLDGIDQVNPQAADRARSQLENAGGDDQLARARAGGATPGSEHNDAVLGPFAAFVPSSVNAKLDGARSAALLTQRVAAAAAILLAACALLLGPRRDRLLRRVGRWGIAVGGVAVLAWIVIPAWVLPQWDSLWSQVAAETLRASGGPLILMFGLIFAGGLATLVLGFAAGQLRPTDHGYAGAPSDYLSRPRSRARLGYRGEFPEDQHRDGRQGSDTWSGHEDYRR